MQLLLDIEFVELVIHGVISFFGDREERIGGSLESLLLLLFDFEEFLELNVCEYTSSLSDLSARYFFIGKLYINSIQMIKNHKNATINHPSNPSSPTPSHAATILAN